MGRTSPASNNIQHRIQGAKMSGFDKVVGSYEEALAGLEDNMTVIAGGFGLCGDRGDGGIFGEEKTGTSGGARVGVLRWRGGA